MPKRAKPRTGRANGKTKPTPRPAAAQPPVVVWPAAAPAKLPGPAPEALARFEEGMAALHRHAYTEAAATFRAVLSGFPAEGALLDRARVYLGLCERALATRPAGPMTAEERLTAATAALNDGDLSRANELAQTVLDANPRQYLALYLLAAVASRQGRLDDALERLQQAITLSPEATAQARHDDDFEPLHDREEFWKLTEPPPVESRGGARRSRRGRATG